MIKYFLDCGTQFGQGLESIINLESFQNVKIFSFEANPYTFQKINFRDDVTYFNLAVSTKTQFQDFNCEEENGGGSSLLSLNDWNVESIYGWENGARFHKNKTTKVMTISILDILHQLCQEKSEKSIVAKLDIEGMEFPILDFLNETDNLKWFSKMYIEWHDRSIINKALIKRSRNELLEILNKNSIETVEWH